MFKLTLFGILLLSLFLRAVFLSDFPPGFHVDEVKVGWNTYSLLKTGRDDWGHPFPLHYNSFGDYRPTGYFYVAVLPVFLLGLNEFSTRIAPAIFGALTLVPLFWLVYFMTTNKKIALLSTLLLALSPWHISLSRSASEGVISLCLVIIGLVYLVRYLKRIEQRQAVLSLFFFGLSYFFYHSARLLSPFLATFTLVYFLSTRHISYKKVLIPVILGFLTLAFFSLPSARGRFSQVSVFSSIPDPDPLPISLFDKTTNLSRKVIRAIPKIVDQFTYYLNPRFYVSAWEAKPYRYATSNAGLISYSEFIFLGVGLIVIAKGKRSTLPIVLLILSIFPAALTLEDSPNLHRSLFIIPFLTCISAIGLHSLLLSFRKIRSLILILFVVNFSYFAYQYFFQNSKENRILSVRNFGTRELILSLPDLQDSHSEILLSNYPDHLYPWFGFYHLPNPKDFNAKAINRDKAPWAWENILFSHDKCPSILLSSHPTALAVDRSDCVEPNLNFVSAVAYPDNTGIFSLWTQ